jgi:hypothetical protein
LLCGNITLAKGLKLLQVSDSISTGMRTHLLFVQHIFFARDGAEVLARVIPETKCERGGGGGGGGGGVKGADKVMET